MRHQRFVFAVVVVVVVIFFAQAAVVVYSWALLRADQKGFS